MKDTLKPMVGILGIVLPLLIGVALFNLISVHRFDAKQGKAAGFTIENSNLHSIEVSNGIARIRYNVELFNNTSDSCFFSMSQTTFDRKSIEPWGVYETLTFISPGKDDFEIPPESIMTIPFIFEVRIKEYAEIPKELPFPQIPAYSVHFGVTGG